ncbi:hypothetical protein C8R46DRAFT_822052, partial [Mycena filopes]
AANKAIDNGVWIRGVYCVARKSREEARRCAKCQKYDGHLAHACRETVDTCGRRAGRHRTAECSVTDSGVFSCSNCRVHGHGAVDRACPAFVREQEKRLARDPTIAYRYFPTADPHTW